MFAPTRLITQHQQHPLLQLLLDLRLCTAAHCTLHPHSSAVAQSPRQPPSLRCHYCCDRHLPCVGRQLQPASLVSPSPLRCPLLRLLSVAMNKHKVLKAVKGFRGRGARICTIFAPAHFLPRSLLVLSALLPLR